MTSQGDVSAPANPLTSSPPRPQIRQAASPAAHPRPAPTPLQPNGKWTGKELAVEVQGPGSGLLAWEYHLPSHGCTGSNRLRSLLKVAELLHIPPPSPAPSAAPHAARGAQGGNQRVELPDAATVDPACQEAAQQHAPGGSVTKQPRRVMKAEEAGPLGQRKQLELREWLEANDEWTGEEKAWFCQRQTGQKEWEYELPSHGRTGSTRLRSLREVAQLLNITPFSRAPSRSPQAARGAQAAAEGGHQKAPKESRKRKRSIRDAPEPVELDDALGSLSAAATQPPAAAGTAANTGQPSGSRPASSGPSTAAAADQPGSTQGPANTTAAPAAAPPAADGAQAAAEGSNQEEPYEDPMMLATLRRTADPLPVWQRGIPVQQNTCEKAPKESRKRKRSIRDAPEPVELDDALGSLPAAAYKSGRRPPAAREHAPAVGGPSRKRSRHTRKCAEAKVGRKERPAAVAPRALKELHTNEAYVPGRNTDNSNPKYICQSCPKPDLGLPYTPLVDSSELVRHLLAGERNGHFGNKPADRHFLGDIARAGEEKKAAEAKKAANGKKAKPGTQRGAGQGADEAGQEASAAGLGPAMPAKQARGTPGSQPNIASPRPRAAGAKRSSGAGTLGEPCGATSGAPPAATPAKRPALAPASARTPASGKRPASGGPSSAPAAHAPGSGQGPISASGGPSSAPAAHPPGSGHCSISASGGPSSAPSAHPPGSGQRPIKFTTWASVLKALKAADDLGTDAMVALPVGPLRSLLEAVVELELAP
ncbi:hypothetical protein WJX72_007837 [[Myrmecia] bisecta]|uniref:Uncharacterized protein n=1 Tax=[Myrmecia] bisecta TaxID=41462 RepID=A0AAW1PC25_9CHLO